MTIRKNPRTTRLRTPLSVFGVGHHDEVNTAYRYGERGDHIRDLQQALIDAGYDLPEYGADGSFGDETAKAILQFEQQTGIATESMSLAVDEDTLEALMGEDESKPSTPIKGLPVGKGMFIRVFSHLGDPNEQLADFIQDNGITWVAIQRIWQFDDKGSKLYNGSSKTEDYLKIFDKTCVQKHVWGYPVPGESKEEEFVSVMTKAANDWDCTSVMIDAEGPYYNHRSKLVPRFRGATQKMVGFTSYGAPWFHKTFPWEDFVDCDYACPQIYDSNDNMGPNYPSESVDAYKNLGFKNIIPASGAYKKTRQLMEDLIANTQAVNPNAIIWWDWYNAGLKEFRWEVIAETQVPQYDV